MTTQPVPGKGLSRLLLPAIAALTLALAGAWSTTLKILPGDIVADPVTTDLTTRSSSAQPSSTAPSSTAPSSTAASSKPFTSTAPLAPTPPQVRVLFGTDSAALTPAAKADLNRIVVYVKATSDTFVVVQGRSDSQGSTEAKHRASVLRAETVEDYLAAMGVPKTRLSHSELSDTAPVKASTSASVAAANRSVDVLVKRTT
jgi:outer membrane protein OmpA-like peptidoglycan-associated protein